MATDSILCANGGSQYKVGETLFDPRSYRCHLAILKDEDGRFSVIVLNLPGAGSCGDTEDEAVHNAREAVTGVIESYIEDGEEIPWKTEYSIPEDSKLKWILVNA